MSSTLNPVFAKYAKLINQTLSQELLKHVDADQYVIDFLVKTLGESINALLNKMKIECQDIQQTDDINTRNFMTKILFLFTSSQRRKYVECCIDLDTKCNKRIEKYIKLLTKMEKKIITTSEKPVSVLTVKENIKKEIEKYMKYVQMEKDKIKLQLKQKLNESLERINEFAKNKNITIPSFTKIECEDIEQTDDINTGNLDTMDDENDSISSDSSIYSSHNQSEINNKSQEIPLQNVLFEFDELYGQNECNKERDELDIDNTSKQNEKDETEALINHNEGNDGDGDLTINSIEEKKENENNIVCICNRKLIKTNSSDLSTIYSEYINCDKCDKQIAISNGIYIYHCSVRSRKHRDGYDICMQCANNINNSNHDQDIPSVLNQTIPPLNPINDNSEISTLSNNNENANGSREINNNNYRSKTRKTSKTKRKRSSGKSCYICFHCRKTFGLKKDFEKHNKTEHNDDTPYHCDRNECNKSYTAKNTLSKHIKSFHEKQINANCQHCGKGFFHRSDLKTHLLSHSEQKPFQCNECNQCFKRKVYLQRHIDVVHRNIKPYICEQCGGRFGTKHELIIHQRRHTGEKPYVCEYCNKPFASRSNLSSHRRIHNEEKPFECKVCHRTFNNHSNKNKHEKNIHKLT